MHHGSKFSLLSHGTHNVHGLQARATRLNMVKPSRDAFFGIARLVRRESLTMPLMPRAKAATYFCTYNHTNPVRSSFMNSFFCS